MQRFKMSFAGASFGLASLRSQPLTTEERKRAQCKASQTMRNRRVKLKLRAICAGCDTWQPCANLGNTMLCEACLPSYMR